MAGKCVAQASAEPQSCPPHPVLLYDPNLVPARANSVRNRDRRVGLCTNGDLLIDPAGWGTSLRSFTVKETIAVETLYVINKVLHVTCKKTSLYL